MDGALIGWSDDEVEQSRLPPSLHRAILTFKSFLANPMHARQDAQAFRRRVAAAHRHENLDEEAELVSKQQALSQVGLLTILRSISETLTHMLQDFRVRYTDARNAMFSARMGARRLGPCARANKTGIAECHACLRGHDKQIY